jgi:hypothetical protein
MTWGILLVAAIPTAIVALVCLLLYFRKSTPEKDNKILEKATPYIFLVVILADLPGFAKSQPESLSVLIGISVIGLIVSLFGQPKTNIGKQWKKWFMIYFGVILAVSLGIKLWG